MKQRDVYCVWRTLRLLVSRATVVNLLQQMTYHSLRNSFCRERNRYRLT